MRSHYILTTRAGRWLTGRKEVETTCLDEKRRGKERKGGKKREEEGNDSPLHVI